MLAMLNYTIFTKDTPKRSYYDTNDLNQHAILSKERHQFQYKDYYEQREDTIAENRYALKVGNLPSKNPCIECYNDRSSKDCSKHHQKLSGVYLNISLLFMKNPNIRHIKKGPHKSQFLSR